jgi:hypothetical protein
MPCDDGTWSMLVQLTDHSATVNARLSHEVSLVMIMMTMIMMINNNMCLRIFPVCMFVYEIALLFISVTLRSLSFRR